jgi:ABC-type glycerol-3-phosphate transport system substrate-binding protein
MRVVGLCVAALLFTAACGGSAPPPESPETEAASESESEKDPVETWSADGDKPGATEEENPGPKADANAPQGEPQFTENMSVDEATKAVPRGTDRANIDPDDLGKPLQNADVYAPCKPGTARVKLRIAVWDGRAVGVDVTTTPKNDKLAECIKGRIRELKWDAKVRSLNTIEYQL